MWEERDGGGEEEGEEGGAGHSVIQRVVSPRSAAGRGFTAKRGREEKRKRKKKRTKAADTLKGDFVKIAHRKCRFQHTHTHEAIGGSG